MEYASIEREIHIDASPEVVFEVISTPEHIREWWDAETDVQPTPGSTGELVWADGDNPRSHVVPINGGRRRAPTAVQLPVDARGGGERRGRQLEPRHLRAGPVRARARCSD